MGDHRGDSVGRELRPTSKEGIEGPWPSEVQTIWIMAPTNIYSSPMSRFWRCNYQSGIGLTLKVDQVI
jgi:hypothetical protein